MTEQINFSLSQLSLQSTGSAGEEDWDRSMQLQSEPELDRRTPRNSVVFPGNTDNSGEGDTGDAPGRTHGQSTGGGKPKRTLSELLRLHAANGPDGTFSPEEANRVAEVLGQWINSSSSPYESEDDFFTRAHSQDDSSITTKRSSSTSSFDTHVRPRGQSASVAGQS